MNRQLQQNFKNVPNQMVSNKNKKTDSQVMQYLGDL